MLMLGSEVSIYFISEIALFCSKWAQHEGNQRYNDVFVDFGVHE